jgi:chromate transporter
VLPLLKQATVDQGWIGEETFLAGYGAAQALPGPLFSFAAFLGAAFSDAHEPLAALSGGAIGLAGIFLPGMLILIGILPFWSWLQGLSGARAAMMGANAAVVGILAAALYNPVWTGTIASPMDAGLAVAGICLLTVLKAPPIWIVFLGAAAGVLQRILGLG